MSFGGRRNGRGVVRGSSKATQDDGSWCVCRRRQRCRPCVRNCNLRFMAHKRHGEAGPGIFYPKRGSRVADYHPITSILRRRRLAGHHAIFIRMAFVCLCRWAGPDLLQRPLHDTAMGRDLQQVALVVCLISNLENR